MANWIIRNQDDGFELYWRSGQEESSKKCTQSPQAIDIIHQWLLEPTQASFCDIIQYQDGSRFVVMATAEC